jgi:hypothetical protein
MPGDPKECRKNAACYREEAARASNAVARATFANLADTWDRLATELESAREFLKVMETMEADSRPAPLAAGVHPPIRH